MPPSSAQSRESALAGPLPPLLPLSLAQRERYVPVAPTAASAAPLMASRWASVTVPPIGGCAWFPARLEGDAP